MWWHTSHHPPYSILQRQLMSNVWPTAMTCGCLATNIQHTSASESLPNVIQGKRASGICLLLKSKICSAICDVRLALVLVQRSCTCAFSKCQQKKPMMRESGQNFYATARNFRAIMDSPPTTNHWQNSWTASKFLQRSSTAVGWTGLQWSEWYFRFRSGMLTHHRHHSQTSMSSGWPSTCRTLSRPFLLMVSWQSIPGCVSAKSPMTEAVSLHCYSYRKITLCMLSSSYIWYHCLCA